MFLGNKMAFGELAGFAQQVCVFAQKNIEQKYMGSKLVDAKISGTENEFPEKDIF